MDTGAAPYEFGSSAEDRTVLLGLRGRQLGLLAGGLVFAVLIVRSSPSGSAFLGAAGAVGVASVLAFWPIGGRTIEEWAPTLLRWAVTRVLRRERWTSPAPLLGQTSTGDARQCPPPTLDGTRILAAPVESDGRNAGIVHDRRVGTYAAVLAVRGRSFQLADAPEKQRRLATWAACSPVWPEPRPPSTASSGSSAPSRRTATPWAATSAKRSGCRVTTRHSSPTSSSWTEPVPRRPDTRRCSWSRSRPGARAERSDRPAAATTAPHVYCCGRS